MKKDLVVIGAGPAGLAAAISAKENGVSDILVIERDSVAGGILNQCIHNGFGLTHFKENMTGPEYAHRFIEKVNQLDIEILLNTTVLDLNKEKVLTIINENGVSAVEAKAVILAMGCRERSKGALNIAGFRPSGLFSAGTAQKYVNLKGLSIGKEIVILGSGDIGLIMARRLTLEGAKVLAVCEIMPTPGGLRRNIAQCLDDFEIPLYLSHTITQIHGKDRVEGVTIAKVESKIPILSSERFIKCDTVLFSVGLIPENELSKKAGVKLSKKTNGAIVDENRQTSVAGIFACGNVLHVHDLVDFVSEEAEIAGKSAARHILCQEQKKCLIYVKINENVSYCVPQIISRDCESDIKLFFRSSKNIKNAIIEIACNDKVVLKKKKFAVSRQEMETVVIKPQLISNADSCILRIVGED